MEISNDLVLFHTLLGDRLTELGQRVGDDYLQKTDFTPLEKSKKSTPCQPAARANAQEVRKVEEKKMGVRL